MWVDAWEVKGREYNYSTSNGELYWSKETASHKGIVLPQLLPQRRIDYIFSYEWVYGKVGSPLSFNTFGSLTGKPNEISDHYGLWADIYAPLG